MSPLPGAVNVNWQYRLCQFLFPNQGVVWEVYNAHMFRITVKSLTKAVRKLNKISIFGFNDNIPNKWALCKKVGIV